MRPEVRPTGVERTFSDDEFIVTKTDLQGRITYANDLFCRISAFEERDVIGQPHNLIRHPEMPRTVFSLLWETIASGKEIFAYVINLAGDGGHYWVFAHVTPTVDASGRVIGYHSNRRRPGRSAVDDVRRLYSTLLQEERRHSSANTAAASGRDLLRGMLDEKSTTYDELIWSITSGAMV